MPLPERLAQQPFDEVQVTLVLVVDVTKGEWALLRPTCLFSRVSIFVDPAALHRSASGRSDPA